MRVGIKTQSPNTEDYRKYIIAEIVKHGPLVVGERVVLHIEEGHTPMPEFTEIPTPPGRVFRELKDKKGKVVKARHQVFDPKSTIEAQITDEQLIFSHRSGALYQYTYNTLKGLCDLYSCEFGDNPPIKATFHMTVFDPKRLYQEAEKIGVEIPSTETAEHKENLSKDNKPVIVLCLDKAGNLWREPRGKFCYSLDERSNRHKLIRYLAESKEYRLTAAIAAILDTQNKQYVRGEIPKINNNAKKFLKINAGKLIEGKSGSGYRISPKYRIKVLRT